MKTTVVILTALLLFGCSESRVKGQESEDISIEQSEKQVKTITQISEDEEKSENIVEDESQNELSTGYLVVTFSSRGSGIDATAIKKLEDIIVALGLNKVEITPFEIISWGREGEIDYCFDMSLIDKELAFKLQNKTKSEFSANKLVQIEEHENCPRKKD